MDRTAHPMELFGEGWQEDWDGEPNALAGNRPRTLLRHDLGKGSAEAASSSAAPGATLGGYAMTAFGDDGLPVFTNISSLALPQGGSVGFSRPVTTRARSAAAGLPGAMATPAMSTSVTAR